MDSSSGVAKALADARASRPQPATPTPKPAENPNPAVGAEATSVKVKSLAEGIKAKGLHDLMAGAEEMVRTAKYDLAIQNYNKAQRVAPNNALTQFGRANAELAGGYYQRAEQDLRVAFGNSPALLLLKFDVASLFPKDRLPAVRNDLRDLTTKEPALERPWFLLAYLDYHTGDPAAAGTDLDEAEKRSGAVDAILIRRMRQAWALPSNLTKPAPAVAPKPAPPVDTPAPEAPKAPAPPKAELNK
jgi:tetratricopeptide (TPR) repeat protein